MNKAELVEAVANSTGYAKSQVNEILSEIVATIGKKIKKEPIQLVGLGTFKAVKRKARTGVNPATGEKIKIKAKTTTKFTPSANLKTL